VRAREALSVDALELRDLLKFEFFFLPKDRFLEDLERELEIIAPRGWAGQSARAIGQSVRATI